MPKPTTEALSAAEALIPLIHPTKVREVAEIIDRETGLPQMLLAMDKMVELISAYAVFAEKLDAAARAIAKANGRE